MNPKQLWFPRPIAELERDAIDQALRYTDGNKTHAARLLGISIRTLRNKVRDLGLTQWYRPWLGRPKVEKAAGRR